MKKKHKARRIVLIVVIIIVAAFIGLAIAGSQMPDEDTGTSNNTTKTETSAEKAESSSAEIEEKVSKAEESSTDEEKSSADTDSKKEETKADDAKTSADTKKDTDTKKTDTKEKKKNTKKNLQAKIKSKYHLNYRGKVTGDKTGNWRYADYISQTSQQKLALKYYKAFFNSDDERHFLINRYDDTIANIGVQFGETLDVRIQEYTNGEEYSADTLSSGDLIHEYWVNIKDGKITKIQ